MKDSLKELLGVLQTEKVIKWLKRKSQQEIVCRSSSGLEDMKNILMVYLIYLQELLKNFSCYLEKKKNQINCNWIIGLIFLYLEAKWSTNSPNNWTTVLWQFFL